MKPIIAAGFYSLAVYNAASQAIKFLVSPWKENNHVDVIEDRSRISYTAHRLLTNDCPSVDILMDLSVKSVMEVLESPDYIHLNDSKNVIARVLKSEHNLSSLWSFHPWTNIRVFTYQWTKFY